MNKSKNAIGILSIVLILFLSITSMTFVVGSGNTSKAKSGVTNVATPNQTKALVPKWAETIEFKLEDLGTNIAKGKAAVANAFEDVYEAGNATDGKVETYWEGKANAYPNIITVNLGASAKVAKIRLRVNPDKIWGKRVQGFTVLGSINGKDFTELVPSSNYQYDPKTGNLVTVTLPSPADVQYVRIQFTQNTGASGGQISEFEVFAAK